MTEFLFDRASIEPLWRAKSGDYSLLAARIRNGSASQEERDRAADVLEGRRKPPANRPASYDTFLRDLDIYYFVEDKMASGNNKDSAVLLAEDKFKLSKTTIYEIIKRMEAANDAAHSDN
jgi:hypothetical protein